VTQPNLAALIHLAGFGTGIVLYAMLAMMITRRRVDESHGDAHGAGSSLPLAAACLGLLWNSGALVIYALRDFGLAVPPPWFVAIAFSALGFLPAVVVHSALGPRPIGPLARGLVAGGYALSTVAGALTAVDASAGIAPSRPALFALTVGYAALLVLLGFAVRRRHGWQRNLSTVALAAFAVSALHLSHDAAQPDSWISALLGHHASLPLVLVILYYDYRFAFADLFLRRALSLVVLVALALTMHVLLATPLMDAMRARGSESLFATAAHVALWVATALTYPFIRRTVGSFVDRVILDRTDYRHARDDVAFAISGADAPEEILERATGVLASALGAGRVRWLVDEGATPSGHASVIVSRESRDDALVRIPTTDAPRYAIEIAGLAAGRRLLSDDVSLLESAAAAIGRRIDACRILRERFDRDLREREITQLAAEAELKALRAQLNPHFLFNALTTIGYLMRAAPDRALGTLYRLTELLRAVLRRPAGELVTLGEELEIVEAYLAIEHERFEERLQVSIDVAAELRTLHIPPLLVQPLVENAVKHGISPLRRGGRVSISATTESPPRSERDQVQSTLRLTVGDTGIGIDPHARVLPRGPGLGLASVERRLERHYGSAARFEVTGAPGVGTTVTLWIPIERATHGATLLERAG
jgi:hypothetical protein